MTKLQQNLIRRSGVALEQAQKKLEAIKGELKDVDSCYMTKAELKIYSIVTGEKSTQEEIKVAQKNSEKLY